MRRNYCSTCIIHLCRIGVPVRINWTSPIPLKGFAWYSLVCFFFIYEFVRSLCKQTVNTLIRRRALWRLIWVSTIYLWPTNGRKAFMSRVKPKPGRQDFCRLLSHLLVVGKPILQTVLTQIRLLSWAQFDQH